MATLWNVSGVDVIKAAVLADNDDQMLDRRRRRQPVGDAIRLGAGRGGKRDTENGQRREPKDLHSHRLLPYALVIIARTQYYEAASYGGQEDAVERKEIRIVRSG